MLRKNTRFPIEKWKNILDGEPVFILGNSPSIGNEDLSVLEDYFTIGINRIYMLFEPTILFWQDKGLYLDGGRERVDQLGCVKVCREQCDQERRYTNFRVKSGQYAFGKNPSVLQGHGCSAAIACQMAVAMGCGSIVLLGCDGEYINGKTDFYGKNTQHRSHTLRNFTRAYDFIKNSCPNQVINCSQNKRWPQQSLEQVIQDLNPSPKAKGQWQSLLYS